MGLPATNVLIVEDDTLTRDMLATLLARQGFHPVAADDGLEALHLCARCGTGRPMFRVSCCWI